MSTPTPQRPTMDDDLDQAYARSHALAGDERGPAPAVRASVLAAAREIAAQAAQAAPSEAPPPPLVPVAPPVADVGRGRAGAWNLSSWRLRSGAAFCAVLLVGLLAARLDASRKAADNVTLASADRALSVQVMPAPAPADPAPPSKMMAPVPQPTLVAPSPRVELAKAAPPAAAMSRERAEADTVSRDAGRAVARADKLAAGIGQSREHALVADARAAPGEPATGYSTASTAADPHADVARKIASLAPPAPAARLAATGSTMSGAPRPAPTPLHVAADADDVGALTRLLADPATRVDAPDALGRTALQYAVAAANVRAVRLLLAAGADPDHADASGGTPRSVARTGTSAEIAALLAAR